MFQNIKATNTDSYVQYIIVSIIIGFWLSLFNIRYMNKGDRLYRMDLILLN